MFDESGISPFSYTLRTESLRDDVLGLDRETLLFELLQRGVDVESVPKDDDVYDQSERSELIFLSFMISLAEFATLSESVKFRGQFPVLLPSFQFCCGTPDTRYGRSPRDHH